MKNRVDLNFKFDQPLTDLIDEYIHEFRPTLLRGTNASWLFPGEDGKPKHELMFGNQITERIQKAVGLRITPPIPTCCSGDLSQAPAGRLRDGKAAARPPQYPDDDQFYCGLETTQATEQFGKLIREQIKFDLPDA